MTTFHANAPNGPLGEPGRRGAVRVVCGRGRDPTLSVSRCPTGRRQAAPRASAGRGRRPSQRPRPARRFPSSRRGARCLRCFRQRPHRSAPRWPAGAGPLSEPALGEPVVRTGRSQQEVGDQVSGPVRHGGFRPLDAEHAVFDASASDRTGPRRGGQPAQAPQRTGARRASRADWPEPAGCGRHQRRREPTAAPFGCRRSGGTAPARRRRRGTRPAGATTPAVSQKAVIRASCGSRARRSLHPEAGGP